jgi:hypothetical protein
MSIAKTSIAFAFLAAAASLPALLGGVFDSRASAPAAPAIESSPPAPSQDATPHPAQEQSPNEKHRRHNQAPPQPDEPWPYQDTGEIVPV